MTACFRRHPTAMAYLLLAPGLLYLAVFYVVPDGPDVPGLAVDRQPPGRLPADLQLRRSTPRRSRSTGDAVRALDRLRRRWPRILTFLLGFPLAYFIAFRGGRYKNLLLFLVIAPFFTSFLLRTLTWKIIFADDGIVLGPLKGARPAARRLPAAGDADRGRSPASPTTSCRS